MPAEQSAPTGRARPGARRLRDALGHSRKALRLLWQTDPRFASALAALSLITGVVPAGLVYTGKLIVDSLMSAVAQPTDANRNSVFALLALAFGLSILFGASQRGVAVLDSLLRLRLAQKVKESILEKTLKLELADFEQSSLYDRLTRARDQASERPLSLVRRALGAIQQATALIAYSALLLTFSPWLVLLLAAVIGLWVVVEVRHNAAAFQLFRVRSPEARRQQYLEILLTRDDHAKEVKHFSLGPLFLSRHRRIFQSAYAAERALTIRRGWMGFCLGLLASAFAAVGFVWVAWAALEATISLGTATMLLLAVRQAHVAGTDLVLVAAGMHEDHLYYSTLDELLAHPETRVGTATAGTSPGDGIRFQDVWFSYPDSANYVLRAITFQATPGSSLAIVGSNGAGKSTLVKLLLGLYRPTRGAILLDGRDLREWDPRALHTRLSAVFQDFVRYQLTAGENIGVGDVDAFDNTQRREAAARLAHADPIVSRLSHAYDTQLGHWFPEGAELSQGEWQKLALARLFMHPGADILVLDEPTHSLDAQSENALFEELKKLSSDRILFVVSHRPSTVRFANQALVLKNGGIVEFGAPERLLQTAGEYSRLFAQAGPLSPSHDPLKPESDPARTPTAPSPDRNATNLKPTGP